MVRCFRLYVSNQGVVLCYAAEVIVCCAILLRTRGLYIKQGKGLEKLVSILLNH